MDPDSKDMLPGSRERFSVGLQLREIVPHRIAEVGHIVRLVVQNPAAMLAVHDQVDRSGDYSAGWIEHEYRPLPKDFAGLQGCREPAFEPSHFA